MVTLPRIPFRRANLLLAASAVAVGALLFGVGRFAFSGQAPAIEAPRYLVYRRNLEAGHPLQWSDLKMLGAQAAVHPPADAVTDQDLSALRGAVTINAVPEGAVVTFASLRLSGDGVRVGKKIPLGMRAFPLPLDPSWHLQPSDCIDVFSGDETLVEGAVVLAVQPKEEGSDVLVALSPEEVPWVEKAIQTGKLRVSQRNPDEVAPHAVRHRTKSQAKRKRVQIWSEGNG